MKLFRYSAIVAVAVGLIACSETKEEPKQLPEELPANQEQAAPAPEPAPEPTPEPEPAPAETKPAKKKAVKPAAVEEGAAVQKKANRDAEGTVAPPTVQKKAPRE
ncbi:MAG: hypothetical protein D8M52_04660 [Chlorobi bacterium]|nr:MAG: hypothetical protein F9K28_03790 [Bacteroidota bacterium]KXK34694.1 MAG: hypothetical protein UZ06_CHB003001158 [Chlorobi bacterium OLB6]MBE2264968.1 hypothetical protein [Flavobacteriales bacterium]MBL1160995.1 hypothetical protein [Chlorobiota bacterium]MBW7852953.1 hypothetical protein [Candidatus Kapabacteria bacterium]MCC6330795.1 hypothetical protein [Ignavibacteria bacterium]